MLELNFKTHVVRLHHKSGLQQLFVNFRLLIVLVFLLTGFVVWMNSGIYFYDQNGGKKNQSVEGRVLKSSAQKELEAYQSPVRKEQISVSQKIGQVIAPGQENGRKDAAQWWSKMQSEKQVQDYIQSRNIVASDYQIIEDAFCFCNCQELDQQSIFDQQGREHIKLNPGAPQNYLNQIFDQVYIINYEHDKRDYIKGLMRFLGIQATIVNSIPNTHKSVQKYLKSIQGSFLVRQFWTIETISENEIAKRLSHFRVYEDVIYNQFQSVLILEDDIDFTAEIGKIIGSVDLQMKEKNWDFIFYGHCQENLKENGDLIQRANSPKCMHAYAMHGYQIAQQIIKDLSKQLNLNFGDAIQGVIIKENMDGFVLNPPPIFLIEDQQNTNNDKKFNLFMQNSIRIKIKEVLRASEIPDCYIQLFRE